MLHGGIDLVLSAAGEGDQAAQPPNGSAGRVTGVTLTDGETIRADVVISNADAHRTFQDLIAPQHLRCRKLERKRNFRSPHSIFSTYIATDIDISATRPATNYILHHRYDFQTTHDMLDAGQ